MNISVNFGTDVQSHQIGHRAAQVQQQKSATDLASVAAHDNLNQVDAGQTDAPRIQPNSKHDPQVTSSSTTELQVNNSDYRIKMLIERQAGNTTMQTVLNFYKIQPEHHVARPQHDVDVLA